MDWEGRKVKVLERIISLDQVIKGSVIEMKRYCGKKNCRCYRTKAPHKSLFISFRYEGKTRMIPVEKDQVAKIKRRIKDYKELKAAIDELARINAESIRRKG